MSDSWSVLHILTPCGGSARNLNSACYIVALRTCNSNLRTKQEAQGTTSYSWDFENRLVSVTLPNQSVVSFDYDPFGRRIRKVAGATTIFVYNGPNLIEERDQSGNVLARYTQGPLIDEPLAQLRSGTTSYYQADAQGTVTSLSNSGGALADTYTYGSFGNLDDPGRNLNPHRE